MRICALAIAALAAACTPPPDMPTIEAEIASFHQLQASGDDRAGYRALASDFRNATDLETFTRLNDAVRNAQGCGPPVRDPVQWRSNMTTNGTFVTVVYNRECTGGLLTESFVMRATPAGPKVAGYHIGGMALFPPTQLAAPSVEPPPAPAPTTDPPPTPT